MDTSAKGGADRASAAMVGSIWLYALASGFVAVGLIKAITLCTQPGSLREFLQLATPPVIAIAAGLACETMLARLQSVFTYYRHG